MLVYDGAVSADFDDSVVLSGRLTRSDNAAPIAGKTVTFTMGSESCSQVTDANGEAACSITPSEAAGPFTVAASFTGDGNYVASADSKAFTVTKEETTTAYTGPTVIAQGNPVTLSGRLLEDGVAPIAGRTLTLTLGSGVGSQSCVTGPTDVTGSAQCTVTSVTVVQGPNPVQASFAGDGYYLPSADASKSVIVFAFPSRGIFILGDQATGRDSHLLGCAVGQAERSQRRLRAVCLQGVRGRTQLHAARLRRQLDELARQQLVAGHFHPGIHGDSRIERRHEERRRDLGKHHQDRRRRHRSRLRSRPRPRGHRNDHRHLLLSVDRGAVER